MICPAKLVSGIGAVALALPPSSMTMSTPAAIAKSPMPAAPRFRWPVFTFGPLPKSRFRRSARPPHALAVSEYVAFVGLDQILARPAIDAVALPVLHVEAVVARASHHQVLAAPAIELVVAVAAVERVGARAAAQDVVAGAAVEVVVARPAVKAVVAAESGERVVAVPTGDQIVGVAAGLDVVTGVAFER